MGSATLEALGLVAHGVHLGLVLLGLVGVCVLLVPGWRESRAARHGRAAWQVPATASEHDQRVAVLRRAISSGTLTGAPPEAAPATIVGPMPAPRRDGAPWRAFAVISSMAAAIVHLAVFPHHVVEAGPLVGIFFVAVAAWQAWWARQLTREVTESRLRAGIVGSVALIALWAWSRTVGLPFGFTDGPERVGAWDLVCELWQMCVVCACLRGLSLRGGAGGRLDPDEPDRSGMGGLGAGSWAWAGLCAATLVVLCLAVPIE